jgi:hypothetical protein
MKLSLIPILSSSFTWTKNCGVAEHSDLGDFNLMQRIYDDACDLGFSVISTKTSQETLFLYSNDVYSKEGELQVTIFTSSCGKFEIHILND